MNYKTILTNKKHLTGNIYSFLFKLIDPLEINFVPGQYMILRVPSSDSSISRLYSIASSSYIKDSLELLVEIIPNGLGSNYLNKLEIKDEVIFQGPAGTFKLRENNKQKVFLVTGTGIAPVRSILRSNIKDQKYLLFWGIKNYSDIYLLEELKEYKIKICLSREKDLLVIPETERQYFDLGHVDSCFEKLITNHLSLITKYEYYLCGGRNIVESLRQGLLAKNISPDNIIFEKF